jgi:glucose dehydrogenase
MRRIAAGIVAVIAVVAVVGAIVWALGQREPAASTAQFAAASPSKGIPAPAASPADDGNWVMPGKDYAATRFSALNQVTPANVASLQVQFTFSTGTTEGFEAPPLVVGNTMFVVSPWPNNVFALDLTKPGAPAKWTYKPNPSAAAKGVACCGAVNRGASYANGRLFLNLLDGNTFAASSFS